MNERLWLLCPEYVIMRIFVIYGQEIDHNFNSVQQSFLYSHRSFCGLPIVMDFISHRSSRQRLSVASCRNRSLLDPRPFVRNVETQTFLSLFFLMKSWEVLPLRRPWQLRQLSPPPSAGTLTAKDVSGSRVSYRIHCAAAKVHNDKRELANAHNRW
jgi:hypothetical protein